MKGSSCNCPHSLLAFMTALYTASLAWWLRRPPRERKILGSNLTCTGIFSGSSHTSDLKNGTPVATLPGAWRYRVSTGTGWPGVSTLWLCDVESWICNFISVWQHVKLSSQIRPWDTPACCWDVKQPTKAHGPDGLLESKARELLFFSFWC